MTDTRPALDPTALTRLDADRREDRTERDRFLHAEQEQTDRVVESIARRHRRTG